MTPPLTLLLDTLKVTAVDDGKFAITVILPPDLVREYSIFLESLAVFFQAANKKSRIAVLELRAASRAIDHEAEKRISAYRERLVSSFDSYTAAGLDRESAIKRICSDLRAADHPWRTIDLVRSSLVAAGRGARRGRPAGRRVKP